MDAINLDSVSFAVEVLTRNILNILPEYYAQK